MHERAINPAIAALRARISQLEGEGARLREVLPFGLPSLDRRLSGGGLALGCLHEVAGGGNGAVDGAAARDMYVRDLRVDSIKVRTRDFR